MGRKMVEAVALIGGLMFLLLMLRVPVAFAVLAAGAVGLWYVNDLDSLGSVLAHGPYENAKSFTLTTVPMFVLMAEFLSIGRFTQDIFVAANRFLGGYRGGVLYAVLAGGVILGAISGSSTAAAGSLARAAFPELKRLGYPDWLSGATVSVTGTLAILIPPSLGLILFGVFTETSVARLLVAGILPGLVTAAGYLVTLWWLCRHHEVAPHQPAAKEQITRLQSLRVAGPVLLLIIGVMGALYSGAITVTEAGAAGAAFSLFLCVAYRRVHVKNIIEALISATRNSAMILSIIIFSSVFATFLILSGVTQDLLAAIASQGFNRWLVLAMILAVILLLGFFLDQLAILLITLPFTFPLLTGLGYEPIWLGIIFAKTAEIGMVTPPFGLNVFVVSGVTKTDPSTIFKGIWPFVISDMMVLGLLIVTPAIATWLPGVLFP